MNQKYPSHEKLKRKKEIDFLFKNGRWLTAGDLRIISVDLQKKTSPEITAENQRVGVSVSKKFFKKAVHRNRIKRLLREAYRHNKSQFISAFGEQSLSMLFWISPQMPKNYEEMAENFRQLCAAKK